MVSGNSCCAPNCINSARTCNLSFFRCPKDVKRAAHWLQNAGLVVDVLSPSFKPQSYRFCSDHFERVSFMNDTKKSLTHSASPTIFNVPTPNQQSLPIDVTIKPEIDPDDFDPVVHNFSDVNLIKLAFRSWLMITRDQLDLLTTGGWPIISMMVLANLETGQYIARVLNRTYKTGQFHNETDLETICLKFFSGQYPCLGRDSKDLLDSDFPMNLQFSPNCRQLCFEGSKPESLDGIMCYHCSLNDNEGSYIDKSDELCWPLSKDEFEPEESQGKHAIPTIPTIKGVVKQTLRKPRPKEGKTFTIEWEGKDISLNLQVDQDKKWTCPICSAQIALFPRMHLKRHLLYNIKCEICSQPHLCPLKLWDHHQGDHINVEVWEVKCVLCSEVLNIKESRNKYSDHLIVCKRKQNYLKFHQAPKKSKRTDPKVCDLCGKTFAVPGLLRKHIRVVHENKVMTWKCHLCSAEMNARKKANHLRQRHLYSRFQCPVCYQRDRSARDFYAHVKEKHPGQVEIFPCPECKAECSIDPGDGGPNFVDHHEQCLSDRLKQMKRDEKERSLAKPLKFACPHCPKKFQLQTLLNSHVRGHKESGHFCAECTYRTHKADLLKAHMIRVHGPKSENTRGESELVKAADGDLQCSVCETFFPSSVALEYHKQTNHVNQSVGFQCRECFQIFKVEKDMESHKSLVHN